MIERSKTTTWEDVVARDKAIIDRVCSDEEFAYYFIYVACEPLLKKILWTVFNNDAEYDELANELYLHLKRPNKDGEYWHNLRTFDYRTSLFDWIKTVAIRLFVNRKNESINIPLEIIENGVITELSIKLDKAFDRKLLKLYVVDRRSQEEVCESLKIESKSFNYYLLSLARKIKSLVKVYYPEYYTLFDSNISSGSSEEPDNLEPSLDAKIDLKSFIESMPNNKYRLVIQRLYIDDISPERLSEELHTPITNIYNLKLRALDQLRDVVILSGEFPDIRKFIFLMSCDRLKEMATSLLVKGESYEEIATKYNLSHSEFRQTKKQILSELKKLIYTKKS